VATTGLLRPPPWRRIPMMISWIMNLLLHMTTWKFVHDGVTLRYMLAKSLEWSIFEEIVSKCWGKMLELS
jgi:hypothetical protein